MVIRFADKNHTCRKCKGIVAKGSAYVYIAQYRYHYDCLIEFPYLLGYDKARMEEIKTLYAEKIKI